MKKQVESVDNYPPQSSHSDEIDLLELFEKYWRERTTIISVGICILALAIAYAFLAPKVYQAKTQLQIPMQTDLAPINNSGFYEITPENAFARLLSRFESVAHKKQLYKQQTDLINDTLNANSESGAIDVLGRTDVRQIIYPNTKDKANIVAPDIYAITLSGKKKETLSRLLDEDVKLGSDYVINSIKKEYTELQGLKSNEIKREIRLLSQALKVRRNNKIAQLTEENTLRKNQLQSQLNARVAFVNAMRSDRIKELQSALEVAESLNINNSKLPNQVTEATTDNERYSNDDLLLYLRGTRLLKAELESLKKQDKDYIVDETVRQLEAEIKELDTNRQIDVLKTRESDRGFSEELQELEERLIQIDGRVFPESFSINFQNTPAITPSQPLKPVKSKIILMGLFFAIFISLLVATCKIVVSAMRQRQRQNQ